MKIKNTLSWLGLIGVFGAIYGLYFWQTESIEALKEYGLRTVGIIEPYGGNVICRYKIDDTPYEFKKSQPFSGLQEGEMYEVAYALDDKENAAVLYENPILPDSIFFLETNSIEVKEQAINSRRFYFKYSVNGKSYQRYQKYKSGEKVDENNTYMVKYSNMNPKIAYLIID